MDSIESKTASLLSYLTFVWIADVGVVGGLLVVNQRSRPIEFHCTAPVAQSRIHEILYGASYEGALFVDQLGKTLFEQISPPTVAELGLVVSDALQVADLRQQVNVPFALMLGVEDRRLAADAELIGTLQSHWSFEKGDRSFTNVGSFIEDRAAIRERLSEIEGNWDLAEPFERIRSAIKEAQRAAA